MGSWSIIMKLPRRNFLHLAGGAAALTAISRFAFAQAYPTRPVRILVGFPPGSAPDIVARLLGQQLSNRLDQPFVIDNRPGASSNIATEAVVHAAPDGYTLLVVSLANVFNATLYPKLNFDFIRDIAPIASIDRQPFVLETHPSVPARTVPHSSPMRRPIPARSTWRQPGRGARRMFSASCSRRWRASTCCTCRIAAIRCRTC
jgi:tripartite-type tricarboxylate transporter receptor subunit TctC